MPEKSQPGAELQDPPEGPQVVLVAVDAFSNAPRVVSMAARVSGSMSSVAMHVVHVFRTSWLERNPSEDAPSAVVEEAKEHLDTHVRALQRLSRKRVVGHLLFGDPAAEILKLATSLNARLLLVGTPDHTGFERMLLGSVADTLVRKAECSLMIVRTKAHEN